MAKPTKARPNPVSDADVARFDEYVAKWRALLNLRDWRIVRLQQDEITGAITSCRVEFFPFFVRDYYNNRWSHSGDVELPAREAA
jgi:hypothetical protein